MKYGKLVSIGASVLVLSSFVFAEYNSKDSFIKENVERLQEIARQYKKDLGELTEDYNELVANLGNARTKLEEIYKKVTGKTWDKETQGDILKFDFDTLLKDGEQFENNVNGDAIAEMLGLEKGATTEQIIKAIQGLQDQIAALDARVKTLEAEISEYQSEQSSLVSEIDNLREKLEDANELILQADREEQEQLARVNSALAEFGVYVCNECNTEFETQENLESHAGTHEVKENVSGYQCTQCEEPIAFGTAEEFIAHMEVHKEAEEPKEEEPEAGTQGTEKQEAYNNLSDNAKALADMGYSNGDLTYRSDIESYVCASATVGEKYESLKGSVMVFNSNVNTYLVNGITQADVEALNNWANM